MDLDKRVCECLSDWDYKTLKANAYNISNVLNCAESSVFFVLRRLLDKGVIIRYKPGIYILKKNSFMGKINDEQIKFRLKKLAEIEHKSEEEILIDVIHKGLDIKMDERLKEAENNSSR